MLSARSSTKVFSDIIWSPDRFGKSKKLPSLNLLQLHVSWHFRLACFDFFSGLSLYFSRLSHLIINDIQQYSNNRKLQHAISKIDITAIYAKSRCNTIVHTNMAGHLLLNSPTKRGLQATVHRQEEIAALGCLGDLTRGFSLPDILRDRWTKNPLG